jgi:hypothetical protein
MTEITQAMKISVIACDIHQGMTEKQVYDFVIWQIIASLEQLPESDIAGMYDEIIAENAH